MNKAELVDAIASKTGSSKKAAEASLNATIEAITEALKAGDKVQLVGFGTFSVQERPARKGKNPRTGEVIEIAAKKTVKFKAGSELTDKVNA